ncbi:condensation domain-containing protein, partial [Streptomyces violascens]|uniref:hypothetical protein n=1 Tax=Streptomyces violascens TaxID=67381 RepID=UPI0036AF5ED0
MTDREGAASDTSAAGQDAWHVVRHSGPGPTAPGSQIAQLVEIHGELDLDTLRKAVAHVVAETTARPVRRAGEEPNAPAPKSSHSLPLPVVDLSTEADPRGAAEAWTRAALKGGAGLGRGGEETKRLSSTQALLRLGPDRHHWFHQHPRAPRAVRWA